MLASRASVCLAWPCTQQGLINYTLPQGLVPGDHIPWKAFQQRERG